jgi:hypothetical protein|tara:strand:+ start:1135 stop:1716 length:582 start_codon:yes stop_codon:yes gene_type:complete
MAETVEIRTHTAGKKYRYLIRNISNIDIVLTETVTATPLPESNDTLNVLTKADGNTTRVTVSWVIHDESTDVVLANNFTLTGASTTGTTPVPFSQFSSDSGFRKADHQVRFLLEPNGLMSNASGIQVTGLTDVYQIIIGETGFSRQGLIENIQITKAGQTPVTWNATMSFVCGNVITGGGSGNTSEGQGIATP